MTYLCLLVKKTARIARPVRRGLHLSQILYYLYQIECLVVMAYRPHTKSCRQQRANICCFSVYPQPVGQGQFNHYEIIKSAYFSAQSVVQASPSFRIITHCFSVYSIPHYLDFIQPHSKIKR